MTPAYEDAPITHKGTPLTCEGTPLTHNHTPLTLLFTPDSPTATTITNAQHDALLYQVVTEFQSKNSHNTVTRVLSAAGDTIASWVWRDIRSDVLTLGKTAPVSMSAWLRKSLNPFNNTAMFSNPINGKELQWRGHKVPKHYIILYSKGDISRPIATFFESKLMPRSPPTPGIQPSPQNTAAARLVVDARGEGILDFVVISFLVLERQRRIKQNSRDNIGDARVAGVSLGARAGVNAISTIY
ncbi:hypothetical protein BDP27DRAFT_1238978 [Rhodocollybia butyracea]|uniref:DUF6593 domain-containing protein n=1 Tax=Rhodocollybia butyracea TaxID=206335 RepID=A0A9P5P9N6_9AGAR|nr:hypothetical protein BDP27DRAFT_1238978 [Rhodocollybia butyracea]